MQMLEKEIDQDSQSMSPDCANELYEQFNDTLRSYGINVLTGEFGIDMLVDIAMMVL